MRNLAAAGAVALTMGLGFVLPALADDCDYYNKNGAYDRSYRNDEDNGAYRRNAMMTQSELARAIERQGYYGVGDLYPNSFGNEWEAIAYVNGRLVSVTVDPYTGRVLYASAI